MATPSPVRMILDVEGTPKECGYQPHTPSCSNKANNPGTLLQDEQEDSTMPLWKKIFWGIFYAIAALASLYFFMVAVKWIGDSFTLILGCESKSAFEFSDNPVAGLMVGTVATALLHSSGTVTSITVALVGAGGLTIEQAVPIIMGANIGTCVTCIMVAFGQVGDTVKFERAMAAATVHDMYNLWSVFVMFPLEIVFHPLQKLSSAIADSGAKTKGGAFQSPVDYVVKPLSEKLLIVDKKMIEKVATGKVACENAVFLKGGVLKGMSEDAAGAVGLIIGVIVLICSLVGLVHMLTRLLSGTTQKVVKKVLNYNGYINILVGTAVTFAVHSSTIVTSTLTPMAGLGLITLEQVYPIVIGANLGTTATALLASLVTGKADSVAVALVHFFFNLFGIFLFYPIPVTRKPILSWAKSLAKFSAKWPVVAVLFILLIFLVVPAILLGLVYVYQCGVVGVVLGVLITTGLCILLTAGLFWYYKRGGREVWYRFLDTREEKQRLKKEGKVEQSHPTEDTMESLV